MIVDADDLLQKANDGLEPLFEALDEQKTEEPRVVGE
jgi:hypothetical protein